MSSKPASSHVENPHFDVSHIHVAMQVESLVNELHCDMLVYGNRKAVPSETNAASINEHPMYKSSFRP